MSEEEPRSEIEPVRPEEDPEAPGDPGTPQFVTNLAPVEQQVGTHVIAALQHAGTVAVLTTVAMGPDGHQRVVSIGLDADKMGDVQRALRDADEANRQRVPCIGFHCYLDERGERTDEEDSA